MCRTSRNRTASASSGVTSRASPTTIVAAPPSAVLARRATRGRSSNPDQAIEERRAGGLRRPAALALSRRPLRPGAPASARIRTRRRPGSRRARVAARRRGPPRDRADRRAAFRARTPTRRCSGDKAIRCAAHEIREERVTIRVAGQEGCRHAERDAEHGADDQAADHEVAAEGPRIDLPDRAQVSAWSSPRRASAPAWISDRISSGAISGLEMLAAT